MIIRCKYLVLSKLQSAYPIKDEQTQQRLLALASLFEDYFTIDWLAELSGFKANRILDELHTEKNKDIIAFPKPGIYFFLDKAIRDQFREDLSADDVALHCQIANILIRDLPEGNDKIVAVSRHLLHIKNDTANCFILFQAGNIYRHLFQNEQAFQCYTKILQDLDMIKDINADRLFAETAIQYSKISTARHETVRVLDTLNEALARAKNWNNLPAQSMIEMHIAKNEWVRAKYDNAITHFERGWAIATELDDYQVRRSLVPFITFFLFWQGKYQEVVANYEKSLPDISDYPERHFPLMGVITVGYCYAQIGQITQGLGMIDSIRIYCLKKGDKYIASMALANMGEVMLTMRRIDEAQQYFREAIKMSEETQNRWMWIETQLAMAFAYQCKEESKLAIFHLKEFLKNSREVEAAAPLPYILDMSYLMTLGLMPNLDELNFNDEVKRGIQSPNIFLRGLAYRYHSFLLILAKAPAEHIIDSYTQSIKWLSISGHMIELARSWIELARYYLSQDEKTKAKNITRKVYKILLPIDEGLIPCDLQESSPLNQRKGKYLFKNILELSKQVIHMRDNRELMQHIISMINQFIGTERGAIFLIANDGSENWKIGLRASKNLTQEEVDHSDFNNSMNLIKETIRTGKGIVHNLETANLQDLPLQGVIRSIICIPMILHNRVIGVLYHDNRLLKSAFTQQDIGSFSYFVAMATIALDNAKAYEEIRSLNSKLQEEKNYYQEELSPYLHFENIIGNSPIMQKVLQKISQVAETPATVLITGETGVGKELVARAVHRLSKRGNKPFISIQLGSLPHDLIPSELFGHEKGAFTGATQRRIGRFELAAGGTLFMDEIGDITKEVQIRLLRILQTRQFERVGGRELLTSDFRLITATNRQLEQEIKAGKFREDLFYRLNIFPIYVPPLRDRIEDIPLLVHHFLNIHNKKLSKAVNTMPKQAMEKLMSYNWPGNVRELENVIERGVILSTGSLFYIPEFGQTDTSKAKFEVYGTLAENERQYIIKTLEKTDWKVSGTKGAAKLLGVPPSTLSYRMKKLKIRRTI